MEPMTSPPRFRPGALFSLLALLLLGGCASPGSGRRAFASMQEAVNAAGRQVSGSVVNVQIQRPTAAATASTGFTTLLSAAPAGSMMNGLILSPEGHILLPEVVPQKSELRIVVWVGDEEHVARVLKADESLGMTIVKIESTTPLHAIDLQAPASLEPGEWAVVASAADESGDFQKFLSLVQNRGEIGGRYGSYQLSTLPRDARGAPVVNLDGRIAALCGRMEVLAFADVADDLRTLLDEAAGVKSDEDEEENRGWLGVLLEPVNRDLAKARNLPVAALWVLHADVDGPCHAAGVRDGDLIVGLNGQPLRFSGARTQEFFLKTARPRPGRPFKLEVMRQGRTLALDGTVTRRPKPEIVRAEDIGISVTTITDTDVFARSLPSRDGVLVTEVVGGSPAATSSRFGQTLLLRQDMIVELDGRPTRNIKEFNAALDALRTAHAEMVLVRYWRGPISGYAGLNMRIGERTSGDRS